MGRKVNYFKLPAGGYAGITNQSPKGFAGVLFLGRGPTPGGGPETVKEQLWAVNQLQGFDKVKLTDVPDEWLLAIGYHQPQPAPEPAPRPVRKRHPQRVEVDVTWWPFNRPKRKVGPEEKAANDWGKLIALIGFVIFAMVQWLG